MAFVITAIVFKQSVYNSHVFARTIFHLKCSNKAKILAASALPQQFSTDSRNTCSGAAQVYTGTLKTQIRNIKIFSLVTSLGGLASQPFLYLKAMESANIVAVAGISSIFGFFAIVSPLLLHLITKKYVTHIYYDAVKNTYIAKTYSLFLRPKKLEFTPDDVVVPSVTGMFSSCVVKHTPLYIEQQCFDDPNHYLKIMGYNKPVDFKFSGINQNHVIVENSESKKRENK